MKKIFSFGAIAAAVMAFAGCAQEIEQPEVPQQEGVAYELVAEVSTKTVNDGMSTKWAEDDALNVFFTEAGSESYGSNNKFTIVDVEEGKFEGTLTTYPDPTKNYDWYVIYPYNEKVTTPASTTSGYLTLGGKTQFQNGVDNMAHIAGDKYPLYGKLLSNPGNEVPALELSHIASLLKVVVKNTTTEPVVVSDVYFTAPEDIVGTYYLNVTGDDAVVCTSSGADYVASTARLQVTDAEVPANGEAAFYLAVKPFKAEAGAQLALAINDVEAGKIVTLTEAKSFEAGVITTLNFTIEEAVEPNLPVEATVAEFLAAETLENGNETEYVLTGVITRMYRENNTNDTLYGNFYLKDETGEVLIYGLYGPNGEKQYWAASGAKIGDTITVKTIRTAYNTTPQGKNAILMELVPFVSKASGVTLAGEFNGWNANATKFMTVWYSNDLVVAENVELTSGQFKVVDNGTWRGLEKAGMSIDANKYYSIYKGGDGNNVSLLTYGTYDVYFDKANYRIAFMTPGKSYDEATEGTPVMVVEGLTEHTWGVIGSFEASANWSVEVAMEVDGDWAVAKNVTLAPNNEFKFRADNDNNWALSYGSACDVNVGETYIAYKNGGNMKFVGEAGAYNLYFSLVTAEFYMEPYSAAKEVVFNVADYNFANQAALGSYEVEDITIAFAGGGNSNSPKYYTSGTAVRCYPKNTINISGATIQKVELVVPSGYTNAIDLYQGTTKLDNFAWEGNTDNLVLTFDPNKTSGQSRFVSIKVTYTL